ncbi:hypothetical protein ABTO93_20630, partial [Acinetobacter baumannii]
IDNFWDWIFKRKAAREILVRERSDDPKQETILFQPDYLRRSNSRIAFSNNKNKLFILSGDTGVALVNAISEQINQR